MTRIQTVAFLALFTREMTDEEIEAFASLDDLFQSDRSPQQALLDAAFDFPDLETEIRDLLPLLPSEEENDEHVKEVLKGLMSQSSFAQNNLAKISGALGVKAGPPSVAQKILDALETSAPESLISMGFWLARVLDEDDFLLLDEMAEAIGEDAANAWLCHVLESSGKYSTDGEYTWR